MAEIIGNSCIYRNPNAAIEDRVKDLLSRMTLKEKLAQMTQIERRVASPYALKELGIGSVMSAGGSAPFERATSADWADMIDNFQKYAMESRLGIPVIYGLDAVHGNSNVYGTTIFPHNVNLGATRDPDLAHRIGAATALEVRASGALQLCSLCGCKCSV
uniref:Beta-glucosidase n=1 Tax=Opuntia streptacantha TaxID=393608 RepID=A0A7C9EXW4_OPUST